MPGGRIKFILGGVLIISAVIYLIISSTRANTTYFITVEDVLEDGNVGKSLKLSGAVIGKTILFDTASFTLTFEIAHIPDSNAEIELLGGLSKVLHDAVNDPSRPRVMISYAGVKPDLLADEVQAIITGHLGDDGIFYADEILLKCPTKYEEAIPEQVNEY